MKTPYLSIIIPLHNETNRLPLAMNKIFNHPWDYPIEVIGVENGSTDDTLTACRLFASVIPDFYFLDIPGRGKGAAVQAGMLAARGEWCYMADVDFSTPVECIDSFLQAALAQKADLVIGSRELEQGLVSQSITRRMIGRLFHLLASTVAPGFLDTQCGFKLFEAQAAREIFSQVQTMGMAFDVEVLQLAQNKGYEIVEMPVPWEIDHDSRVNLFGDGLQMLIDVVNMRYRVSPGLIAETCDAGQHRNK